MGGSLRRGACWATIALASLGCTTVRATEIVVLLRVDPAIAGTPTSVVIDVREPDGELVSTDVDLDYLDGDAATLGVRHRGGALSPITIEARALVGSMPVVDRAVTSFVGNERRLLVLTLRAPCVGVACVGETTCDATATCVSALRPGESLPLFTGPEALDGGIPRDAAEAADSGVLTGDRCLISASCFFDERCADTETAGRCVEPGATAAGAMCASGAECESGVCFGLPGFQVCSDDCSTNLDCPTGLRCLADASTGYDGACVAEALSPCTGCSASLGACVVMRSGAPVCTSGPLCIYGIRCDTGETCALLPDSSGGQAACVVGGTCSEDEMALDVAGIERCTNTRSCEVGGTDCPPDYPECLPGTALGLSATRAGELGLCVRP